MEEVDGYARSVAGVQVEAVRTGPGTGPNRVLAIQNERYMFTSSEIGFPMRTWTTIGDDHVIIGCVLAAPPRSRWCEFDLSPGMVVVYGPGAEHTGVSYPGLRFQFATLAADRLAEHAERLESPIEMPRRGEVLDLTSASNARVIIPTLSELAAGAANAHTSLDAKSGAVLDATTLALTGTDRSYPTCTRGRIDSRHVVHECVNYADSIERIPSINELCLAAHVSERRLRKAFVDEYDLPPTRFFRNWALTLARQRLRAAHDGQRVTDIAFNLGFGHLGRFSAHYRDVYGETPSTTLENTAGVARATDV